MRQPWECQSRDRRWNLAGLWGFCSPKRGQHGAVGSLLPLMFTFPVCCIFLLMSQVDYDHPALFSGASGLFAVPEWFIWSQIASSKSCDQNHCQWRSDVWAYLFFFHAVPHSSSRI